VPRRRSEKPLGASTVPLALSKALDHLGRRLNPAFFDLAVAERQDFQKGHRFLR